MACARSWRPLRAVTHRDSPDAPVFARSMPCLTLRRTALIASLVAAVLVPPAGAAADDCPGAQPACPYVGAPSMVGQRGGGVLRFPQTVAVGKDGAVYVGDQTSHVVQVFNPDGSFQREVGLAGTRPGELGAVGALAVADDNTLLVADSANRINRFDATGRFIGSFGGTGTGLGEFSFGAGGGHDAPAGGGLAIAGPSVFVADSRNDRIQRFALDGGDAKVVVPAGTLLHPRGMAWRNGRLIVADDLNHRLVAFDFDGRRLETIGTTRGSGVGQLDSPFGVTVDPRGRVFVADDLNHRVVRYSVAPRFAYKSRWGHYGTGPGQLAFPRAIASDAAGQLYVTNTGNDRVDVFSTAGDLVRSFGRSGRGGDQFDAPLGVATDASGVRAVADSVNGRLMLLRPDGSVATIWGSPAPGPTLIRDPVAVAFDPAGNAYALDRRRGQVVVFDRATGRPRATFGGLGSGPGKLLDPSALAVEASGAVIVADTGNGRIVRFSPQGAALGSEQLEDSPRGVAVTPDGARLYVSDSRNRITVYGPDGALLDRFGGTGNKLGKLAAPAHLALDAAQNLWVADRGHNRVQQFGPNGERLGMFGTRGTGPGQFIGPTGVSVDCNGTLTVTDSGNHRVQTFALAAPATTACAALAPPATPPPPKAFALPAPVGPVVGLRALRTGNLLGTRNLPLFASCDTACTVTVTATVSPRAAPRRGKRLTVAFTTRTVKLPPAQSTLVRLDLPPVAIARLRKALKAARGLVVDVRLTATGSAGEPTLSSLHLGATR